MDLDLILEMVSTYLPSIVSIIVMICTVITAIKKCGQASDTAVLGVKEQARLSEQIKDEVHEELRLVKAENEALRAAIKEENEATRKELNKVYRRSYKVKTED